MDKKIPTTGRIGRFAKIIQKNTSDQTYLQIMKGSDTYKSKNKKQKADWWREAVKQLEDRSGIDEAENIMRACGQRCCNTGNRKTAQRLMQESETLEEFLEKSSNYGVKPGEIEYKLQDRNTIIGRFNRCFCGQVRYTETAFDTLTYCHCSEEFHRQYFMAALGRPVQVEVTQSIIHGAEHCEFVIRI